MGGKKLFGRSKIAWFIGAIITKQLSQYRDRKYPYLNVLKRMIARFADMLPILSPI